MFSYRSVMYSTDLLFANFAHKLIGLDPNANKTLYNSGFGDFGKENLGQLRKMKEILQTMEELKSLSLTEPDLSIRELFKAEQGVLENQILVLDDELKKSYHDMKNRDIERVSVEIRAGSGGAEAALFSSELSKTYENFFNFKNWNYEILSESSNGSQTREIIFSVDGSSYADLINEFGVHRVQRVPSTDSQGRIHTSTVTVAVIPLKASDNDVLNEKDVRIDVYRSSGPGGQNVNKTNSAVRVVHIPSGIAVCVQEERNQIQNKVKAFKVLRYRLEEQERLKSSNAIRVLRSDQVGSGERSDKIRTYNFPQSRITDHRINTSTHKLPQLFEDPRVLEELISLCKIHQLKCEINKIC